MISTAARLKPLVETLNRFSIWLLLLAIGWLCWTAAKLFWLLLAPPIAPALPLQALQNASIATTDNSSLFAIFADPEPVTTPDAPPPNVALKGVLLAIPESLSSALLEVNGEVKNYRIGDNLQDSGYTLIAVDWNTVIINNIANKQTVISMADSLPLDQRGIDTGEVGNQRLSGTNMLPAAPPQPMSFANNENADSAINSTDNSTDANNPNSAIDEAVTALQENPASYLSRMGVMASGEGYQVTAAMPAGMRNRLGLEPGDRVLTVNGQSVGNDPAQDANILQQVQQAGEAQIKVQRGEQVITIRQQF